MSWYFQAFNRVATCRTMNGDVPYTAVCTFADRNGIAGHDFEDFLGIVEMFDSLNKAWHEDVKAAQEEAKGHAHTH